MTKMLELPFMCCTFIEERKVTELNHSVSSMDLKPCVCQTLIAVVVRAPY